MIMSAVPVVVPTWQWSQDVLDYAARHHVAGYLDPLLQATRSLFPTARDLRVVLEADPGIPECWYVAFEVDVPRSDIPDYIQAQHNWNDELYRICPAVLARPFVITLTPLDS